MITDPLTLGVTGNEFTYNTRETGPGAKSLRKSTESYTSSVFTFGTPALTISHETNKKGDRIRSLFRTEFGEVTNTTLGTKAQFGSPSVYLVVDKPSSGYDGVVDAAVKVLLARILGFLSENATAAPDFDFSSNETVNKFLAGEP